MKDYTNSDPVFSEIIKIVEPTDPAHASLINMAPKQLLQNTLFLAECILALTDEIDIETAFLEEFTKAVIDPTAMTLAEIEAAIQTEWNGETSDDPTAMTAVEVEEATNTEWNGETSDDPTALTALEVEEAIQ